MAATAAPAPVLGMFRSSSPSPLHRTITGSGVVGPTTSIVRPNRYSPSSSSSSSWLKTKKGLLLARASKPEEAQEPEEENNFKAFTSPSNKLRFGMTPLRTSLYGCLNTQKAQLTAGDSNFKNYESASYVVERSKGCISKPYPFDKCLTNGKEIAETLSVWEDLTYLWKLGAGSVGGAIAIKYGSVLFPEITRPNILLALIMITAPMVVAALILTKQSRVDEELNQGPF